MSGGIVATAAAREELARRRSHGRRWLVLLVVYGILLLAALGFAAESVPGYWMSNALVASLGALAMATADLPPAFYGLTLRGALPALRSALLSTALLLLGGVLLLRLLPSGTGPAGPVPAPIADPQMLAHLLVSIPLQEWVFRGVFQSAVRFVLGGGQRASVLAVALSTLAYCAIHLPWGAAAALLVLPAGIVWGVQFERDRSLLGVTLSHAVVGYVYLGALPLWSAVAG